MTIILDNYTIPKKGRVEVLLSFDLNVTAEEARRQVDHWLHQQVSMLISADPPTLVVGERTVWCVPAYISFPHMGRVGVVGTVEVNAESGKMRELAKCKAEILRYLEEKVKPHLPAYKPHTLSANFMQQHIPQAPKLTLPDEEELDWRLEIGDWRLEKKNWH